jgi:hypothetical protein
MSINGLNSNQILTLMQLESGKTYTFVGATGNYSDYMCVTAGMFEAPAVAVTSYRLEVTFKIPQGTTLALSLDGNPQEYGDDAFLCAYDYNSNGNYNQQIWAENFNTSTNVFSLGPNSTLGFIKMHQTNVSRLGSGEVDEVSEWKKNGTRATLHTAYMANSDVTVTDYSRFITTSNSAETITLDYNLYLREAYNIEEYQYHMFWIFRDGDGSYVNPHVRYMYSFKFANFRDTNPQLHNGMGLLEIRSDTTTQNGNTLIRKVTIQPLEGVIGFLYY